MKLLIVLLLACLSPIHIHAQQYCNASLSLDGIDDYGSISESFFSDPGQRTFTMEFYVKSLGNMDPIPGIWGQYGNFSYFAVFNMSGIRFSYLNNGQTYSTDSTINTIGEWEHIAITGDEQTGKLVIFKNGVKIGDRPHGTPDWEFIDNSSRIGAILDILGMQETYYYHGLIDDFHVSDSVLYTQNFTPPTQITPNSRTRVLYDFNVIDGSVIHDLSANNNDLTLHNGAQLAQDVPYPGGAFIITQEPVNQFPDFGEQTQFTVSATGQIQCQWYVNTGNGFQEMLDDGEYSGTKTTQLIIKQAKPQYNPYWYRCIVQRGLCADTSNQVRVFVCGKISQHPSNANAIAVDTASFTLNHTDIRAVYQWQYSNGTGFTSLTPGTNFSGVNTATLRVNKQGLGKGPHILRCIVQSGVCTDTSRIASLIVCGSIITQPSNVQGLPNIPCSFNINHSDPNATFQWIVRKKQNYEILTDGLGISGSKTSGISIDTARYSMNGWSFRCIILSGICNDTSAAGTLYLCGGITGQPSAPVISRPGNTVQLIVSHSDQDAGFQWQKYDTNSWVNMKDGASVIGAKSAALSISNISTKDHGNKYRCITRSVICNDTTLPTILTVCGNIIDQPQNIIAKSGESGSTTISHSDIHAQYKWQSSNGDAFTNIVDIGGITGSETNTLAFNKLALNDHNRKLRCIIVTGGCVDTSNEIMVSVCGRLMSNPVNRSVKQGQQTFFSIVHEDSKASFQWQKSMNGSFMNLMNNQQYFGVSNDTLFLLNTSIDDSASVYRCITYSNGCSDTSKSATLLVMSNPMNDISESERHSTSIRPHPVVDLLQVIGVSGEEYFHVHDILGKEHLHGIIFENGIIDVSTLPKGLYILHIGLNHPQTVTFMKE